MESEVLKLRVGYIPKGKVSNFLHLRTNEIHLSLVKIRIGSLN